MDWDRNERRLAHRRQDDAALAIGREELCLLLESYRESIASNTTILAHQEKITDGQQAIITQIASISESLSRLADQLRAHTQETYREHHGHRLRMYGAYVGLVTIILGLIGLLAKVWPGAVPPP